MINPQEFTLIDQQNFELDRQSSLGQSPLSRDFQAHIRRGFIILDKPAGPTSHDVVATVKKILGVTKAGHLGTLDPAVSGVLPIGIQDGTKILSVLSGANKRYICNLKLHQIRDQQDVLQILKEFTGEIYQFPPLKSNVAMKLRKRTIYEIKLLEQAENEYLLDITCQAGTYIRTLCNDIGKVLGTGGEMKELRRNVSAGFSETETITLHDLYDAYQDAREGIDTERIRDVIRPIESVLTHIPGIILRDNAVSSVSHGAKLAIPGIIGHQEFSTGDDVRILTCKGELVAIGQALVDSSLIAQQSQGYIVQPSRVIFDRNEYTE